MGKCTPGMVKNTKKRALYAVLDPLPCAVEYDEPWDHFESRCAYCRRKLDRARREGHADHLHAAADGGQNGIHNHALACANCNGNEKREMDWRAFMNLKAGRYEAPRTQQILSWIRKHRKEIPSELVLARAARIVAAARASIDVAVSDMRALRDRVAEQSQQDRRAEANSD